MFLLVATSRAAAAGPAARRKERLELEQRLELPQRLELQQRLERQQRHELQLLRMTTPRATQPRDELGLKARLPRDAP